jgi:nucleoid-associated protein YgaU
MILGEMAAVEPRAQTAKPEQFVDLTYIKELDDSGFIDQLYKSRPALAAAGPKTATATVSKEASGAKAAAGQEKRKQSAAVPAKSGTGAHEYTIQPGDTLALIAQKYYGDVKKWTRIFEANRQALKTPNFIFVGQRIIVPPDDMASVRPSGSSQ